MRIIAGVRYGINVRYAINTDNYIFVQDASMQLITSIMESKLVGINVTRAYVRDVKTEYAAHLLGYVGLMTQAEYEKYSRLEYANNAYVGKDGIEYADKGERLELRFGRTDGNWAPYFSFNMEDLEADFSKERMAAENSGGIAGIEKTEYKGAKIWVYDRIRMWDDEDHTDYSWISPNMAEWQRKSIMEYTWTEFKDAEVFCFDTETNTFFLLRYAGEDFVATRSGDDYEGWELVYERDYCMLSREKALEYIKAVIDENR